jgi:hypothetical protein
VAARLHGRHTYQRAEDGDRLVLAFRIAAGLEEPSALESAWIHARPPGQDP